MSKPFIIRSGSHIHRAGQRMRTSKGMIRILGVKREAGDITEYYAEAVPPIEAPTPWWRRWLTYWTHRWQ